MDYIYDIVLNFNKNYYNFFEWNKKDNIVNIKKIPLICIDKNVFKCFKYDSVCVKSDFINLIKDKTYTYSKNKVGNAVLVSNGKEVIGCLFDNKGNLIKRSSLLLDEEEEVLTEITNAEIFNIEITKCIKNKVPLTTRNQREKKNYLIKYINKEDTIVNLKYLYYDYFEVEEDDINIIKDTLVKEIKNNWNSKINSIYDTVKLFNKINN